MNNKNYQYNSWPIGKLPKELQRPEPYIIQELGYSWNDPRDIIDIFENKIAKFAGSNYCVLVDCCTHAIELSLRYLIYKNEIKLHDVITIPNQTYISIYETIYNLNLTPKLEDKTWSGLYQLKDTRIYDSAVRFTENMYIKNTLQCLSFQIKKILSIGRGGAILCNEKEEYDWLKLASYDGRDLTLPYTDQNHIKMFGFHYYMTPEDAARGIILMDKLTKINNDSGNNFNYPDISFLISNTLKNEK